MSEVAMPDIRPRRWDAIVVGAGHNGPTAGALLARAGLSTLVVERRDVVGGYPAAGSWAGLRDELGDRVLARIGQFAPGGGVTGAPGYNAARQVLADLHSQGGPRAQITREGRTL